MQSIRMDDRAENESRTFFSLKGLDLSTLEYSLKAAQNSLA
jgi:hypothetical protein